MSYTNTTLYQSAYNYGRKYHYFRGFIACLVLLAFIFTILVLIVPEPDYTMTKAQYDAFVREQYAIIEQNIQQFNALAVTVPKNPPVTAKTPPTTRKSPTVHPEEMRINTTCYSASNPVPAGVYNPCFIHADGTKTGGAGSYGGTQ